MVRSHRRAMSCQISSIFSTRLVDPSRTSVVRSHSKVMHGPCRPPQQVSAYAPPPRELASASGPGFHRKNFISRGLTNGEESPPLFLTEKQLTAPADRTLRAPAHAVAFSTGVAAGYDRTGPGSPPPNSPSQNRPPTSPAKHIRCSADHRPVWRCDAGPDVRRAVGVCMMGRTRAARSAPHLRSAIWQGTLCPKKEVKMILKEPHARAA